MGEVVRMPAHQWDELLLRSKDGAPKPTDANLLRIMSHGLGGALAYDALAGRAVLLVRPPWADSRERLDAYPREMHETDVTLATLWLQRQWSLSAVQERVGSAMVSAAELESYNLLTEYLEALEWDGVPRLRSWTVDYLRADDSEITREFGRRWLISAVARALRPGCKADTCLVLEGPQGVGKSTALSVLAGEGRFLDHLSDLSTKDAREALRGKWIVEIAELSAIKRTSQVEAVKSFLTTTEDYIRLAYARRSQRFPRMCVFAATTNESVWLADSTGGRRFWPLRCPHPIRLSELARDRDALWAEAVHAYRAGERWWLDAEGEVRACAEVAERIEEPDGEHPWASELRPALAGVDRTTTSDALRLVGVPTHMWERQRKSAAKALRDLGFRPTGRVGRGDRRTVYVRS